MDTATLQQLADREAIRELVLLYSRGVDRKDAALLRDLYTEDATDTHGDSYDGGKDGYVDFLERSFPYMDYSGHHVCNHLVAVDGNVGEGEVYALAWHVFRDAQGQLMEDFMAVRYIDRYRRCADGRWRFGQRVVTYDFRTRRPTEPDALRGLPAAATDPSFSVLQLPLFSRR